MDWYTVTNSNSTDFTITYSTGTNAGGWVTFEVDPITPKDLRKEFAKIRSNFMRDVSCEGFVDRSIRYLHHEKPIARLMNEII